MTSRHQFEDLPVPPQGFDDAQYERSRLQLKYGKRFPNREQFEYFCMLPLSTDNQRESFIQRVTELEREERKERESPNTQETDKPSSI